MSKEIPYRNSFRYSNVKITDPMLSGEHVIFKRYKQASEGYRNPPKKDDSVVHEKTIPYHKGGLFKQETSSKKNMGENSNFSFSEKLEIKNRHSVESGSSSSQGNKKKYQDATLELEKENTSFVGLESNSEGVSTSRENMSFSSSKGDNSRDRLSINSKGSRRQGSPDINDAKKSKKQMVPKIPVLQVANFRDHNRAPRYSGKACNSDRTQNKKKAKALFSKAGKQGSYSGTSREALSNILKNSMKGKKTS